MMTEPYLGVDSPYSPGEPGHLGFFDCDSELRGDIVESCETLLRDRGYTSILLKTTNGYHVIVPHELTTTEVVNLATGCFWHVIDNRHLGMGLVRGFWTLRIGGDITPVRVFDKGKRCHRGMVELLKLLYPFFTDLERLTLDDETRLTVRSFWG